MPLSILQKFYSTSRYIFLAFEKSLLLTKSKTVAVLLMDDALKPSKIINIRPGLDAYFSLT